MSKYLSSEIRWAYTQNGDFITAFVYDNGITKIKDLFSGNEFDITTYLTKYKVDSVIISKLYNIKESVITSQTSALFLHKIKGYCPKYFNRFSLKICKTLLKLNLKMTYRKGKKEIESKESANKL